MRTTLFKSKLGSQNQTCLKPEGYNTIQYKNKNRSQVFFPLVRSASINRLHVVTMFLVPKDLPYAYRFKTRGIKIVVLI